LRDEYHGPGLGETWSISDKRSAFVGTFAEAVKTEVASAGE
jgi:hypothetical protein